MIWVVSILVGLVLGWSANGSARRYGRYFFTDIILGIIGAVAGLWFFWILLGIGTSSVAGTYLLGILWSIIGSGIVVSIGEAVIASSYRGEYEDQMPSREEMTTSRPIAHEYDEKSREEKEHEKK